MTKEPIHRERVEQVWRSEWKEDDSVRVLAPGGQKRHFQCAECGYIQSLYDLKFCQSCGAAMTDEAVDMVMKRLEDLNESVYKP